MSNQDKRMRIYTLNFEDTMVKSLDRYMREHGNISRAEAVRQLVEAGLEALKGKEATTDA